MSMGIGLAAAAANLAALTAILLLEKWYSKRREIRPRAKDFFYLVDYRTIAWGDTIGLTLVDFGVFAAWNGELLRDKLAVAILLLVALVATWIARRTWLAPGHPPSLTYPESGKSNIITGLHLVYFFAQMAVGLAGLYLIFNGPLALVPEVAILLGVVVYAVSIGLDAKDGKF